MRKILSILFVLISTVAMAQSETNDMITYDTIYTESGGGRWAMRITRPRNMFTANHPDTASRPLILTGPGMGEAVNDTNQQKANNRKYGPHYWLANGWDGGVQLANGKHYPILITVCPSYVNPRPPAIYGILMHILNTYRIKRNSVHLGGLSMSAFSWTKSIAYEASPGARTFMKHVTSITAFQGASNETFAPYNAWSLGWDAFGTWAEEWGGTFFGMEGTNDSRKVWQISNNMNARVPGSAYFAFETLGGGAHCCWNEMYSPYRFNWKSAPREERAPDIAWNTTAGLGNTMGTYKDGWSVFQWMLRQGDTTLVGFSGGGGSVPQAVAGPDQTITLPTNSVTVNGSSSQNALSYLWTKISGPSATITNPNSASTTITGLVSGTYVFQLKATNGSLENTDQITITVNNPANTPPVVNAGPDQTVTLSGINTTATMAGEMSDNGTVTGLWEVDGPASVVFSNATSPTTTVTFSTAGVYRFRLTGTDNDNVDITDEMFITVIDPNVQTATRNFVRFYNPKQGSAYQPNKWLNIDPIGTASTVTRQLMDEKGALSPITMTFTNANSVFNNGVDTIGFAGGFWPNEVLQFGTSHNGPRTMTLTGLKPNATYNFYFLCSRITGSNETRITIAEETKSVIVNANRDKTVTFTAVSAPTGTLVINFDRAGTGYTHLNGFIIEEQGAPQEANRAPVASVPGTINLTLPTNSYVLNGAGQDADGDTLTYLWNKEGAGTFSDPDSNVTTISGLTQGQHIVYFTVSDGQFTDVKQVIINVNPAGNTPPVVNAGTDQSLTYFNTQTETQTTVEGTATDNSGVVSYRWEFVSGPSLYTIATPTLPRTEIRNLVAGGYRFRLIATDNQGASSADTLAITVSLVTPTTNNSWIVGIAEYNTYFIQPVTGWLWGVGNKSNDGGGTTTGTAGKPVRVAGDARTEPFDTVVGGLHGGAAISRSRMVWTMGDGDDYQRGNGSPSNTIYYPTPITRDSLGRPFTNIATICGGFLLAPVESNYFVATKYDGSGWIWGRVKGGLLGEGHDTTEFVRYPYELHLPGGRKFRKLIAGNTLMAWATDGTVWTCGQVTNYANLGYRGSGLDYLTWHQVIVPGTAPVIEIAGGGGFNYILTSEMLYGYGSAGNYMGQGTATTGAGTVIPEPIALQNIYNALPGKIMQIAVTYAATHVILDNERMFSWGEQSMSGSGIGKSLNWVTYGWALPGGEVRFFQKQPIEPTPGKKWKKVWGGNTYVYHSIALDDKDSLWGAGRNKAGVLPIRAALATGAINQYIQNGLDLRYWTMLRSPLATDSVYAVTAPTCNSERGTPISGNQTNACASFTNYSLTPPIANAGADRTVTSSTFTLDGSASYDPDGILILSEWEQVGGPTAIIQTPGAIQTLVTVPANGVYLFRFKAEGLERSVRYDTVAITVNLNGNQLPSVEIKTLDKFEVTLPTNSISLQGIGTDIDGTITQYQWSIVSGSGSLSTTSGVNTNLSNLTAGTTRVKLKVTDNQTGTAETEITITVKPAPVTPPTNNPPQRLPPRGRVAIDRKVKY